MKNIFGFILRHIPDLISGILQAQAINASGADKKVKAIEFGSLGIAEAAPHLANHPKVQEALGTVNDALVNLGKIAQAAHDEHLATQPGQ